jgi:bifunctional non-homologous end joining protein LigD
LQASHSSSGPNADVRLGRGDTGKQNYQVQLYAFDVLSVDGEDVRDLPLSMRKSNLDRLLRGRPDGILHQPVRDRCHRARAACALGLECLVSKRSDRPYRGGRSPHWIKIKNRQCPALQRVKEAFR